MSQHQKSWGRISAKPSEYLIVMRDGQVTAHGAGLSVFVWPGATYAVLPTSIQRVSFVADQVTAEKVGVEVVGIAVFRIADPILAFRVLDFDGPEAIARVSEILKDMFVGAARRLVASMSVESCLTRRKEQIAAELMKEISPVVAGVGKPDDRTDRGWGLVIDTIEIQDVRILSEAVFSNLQAPYRAELEMRAQASTVDRDRESHLRRVEAEHATLAVDQELARSRTEAEERSALEAIDRQERQRRAELDAARRLGQMEHDAAVEQAEREAARAAQLREHQRLEAIAAVAAELEVLDQRLSIDRRRGELDAELKRWAREVDNMLTDHRIQYEMVTRVLPMLAQALGEHMGEVHLTHVDTGGDGAGWLGALFAHVTNLARALQNDGAGSSARGQSMVS